jgi:hypothetical protein
MVPSTLNTQHSTLNPDSPDEAAILSAPSRTACKVARPETGDSIALRRWNRLLGKDNRGCSALIKAHLCRLRLRSHFPVTLAPRRPQPGDERQNFLEHLATSAIWNVT